MAVLKCGGLRESVSLEQFYSTTSSRTCQSSIITLSTTGENCEIMTPGPWPKKSASSMLEQGLPYRRGGSVVLQIPTYHKTGRRPTSSILQPSSMLERWGPTSYRSRGSVVLQVSSILQLSPKKFAHVPLRTARRQLATQQELVHSLASWPPPANPVSALQLQQQ